MVETGAAAERQSNILNSAFHVFASYGFRRATMDDIATAAGMSRSALYLHFRNKEDIFRSLALRHFAEAEQAVGAVLRQPQADPATALMAAFVAKDGKFMEAVLGTPHGRELMDAGSSLAAQIAAEAEGRMETLMARWFDSFQLPQSIGTGSDLARSVQVALKGLKFSASGMADYRDGQARLAQLFALALRPA